LVRSGANASGTLTVKEGAQTQSFTLIGTYTTSNFSATSDGHGGTLVTDPPVISGGSVTTNTEIGSGGGSNPDIASTPSTDLGLQWLENMVESVVSDLEGLKTDGGFQQLLNRIEGWGSPGSESMPLDQMSDHSNFQVSGFAAGWQSHMVQTLASFGDGRGGPSQGGALLPNDEGLPAYVAGNLLPYS